MLGAGGTCEFSAQTLRSDRRGAHVSPASARASDPAAPPSGIAHASDDAANPMGTGKTHRLKTCATRRGSEGLPMPREPALLASGGRMPERREHRVSGGQDAGSRAVPGDRKPEPTPGRRRQSHGRSERPATGRGLPRARPDAGRHALHPPCRTEWGRCPEKPRLAARGQPGNNGTRLQDSRIGRP